MSVFKFYMPKGLVLIIDKLFQVQMDLYSLFSISVSTELKKCSTRNYLSVIDFLANLLVVPQSNFPVIHRVGNFDIFAGRNEVVAKVIFLHLFVILFTGGGVCLSACRDTTPPGQTPPRADTPYPSEQTPLKQTPPEQTPPQSRHSPGADKPPWSRHPPQSRPPQSRHPPRSRHPPEHTPLGTDTPPAPGADTPLGADTPPGSTLRHTVNERPVRILLECILVVLIKLTKFDGHNY